MKTLDGEAAAVKLDPAAGAILVVGFSRESNEPAAAWYQAVREAFPVDCGGVAQDVPLYNIVVLAGAPRLIRGLIRRAIRGAVPEEEKATFYIVERDEAFWRELAAAEDDGLAYVLRVGPTGRVQARHSGPVSDTKLDEILSAGCARSGGAAKDPS